MSTRRNVGRLVVALIISAIPLALLAGNPHYKRGGQPVCTINTSTGVATCSTGLVTGLGNGDVAVTVSLSGSADQLCHNKGNPDNVVPGQNPAEATGSSTLNISPDQIKNGNLTIPAISATATVTAGTAAQAGCPSANWTVTLGPVTYSDGVYNFQQPPGNTIPSLSFTFGI